MKFGEITMRNGTYYRMRIEEPTQSWTDKYLKAGGFSNMEEAEKSAYAGSLEFECQYDGKEISDPAVVFFFDSYEKIEQQFQLEEIESAKEYLQTRYDQVPDNAELGLGDVEWYELAYENPEVQKPSMSNQM